MSNQAEFFVAGATLHPDAPSYVTRPADHELIKSVLAGEFCYVLTPQQMGKSSLMQQAVQRLYKERVAAVMVDLSSFSQIQSSEQWYLAIIRQIVDDLKLKQNAERWWHEQAALSLALRFTNFLHDIVLAEIPGSVAIFIDEIDSTLALQFRDDFFAAIRAMYNARASDPTFNRLTFVLLGVATPTDLIQDRTRTPFNIGTRIVLQAFSYEDVTPLRHGLERYHPGQAERILRRIFYWTGGHPYLTQKLCLAAAQTPRQTWDDAKIDSLVAANFFGEASQRDPNVLFVQKRVHSTPPAERRRMLELYRQIYNERNIQEDDRSATQNYLELLGLVRKNKGILTVHNEIYRHVFNETWIRATLGGGLQRYLPIVGGLVALLLVFAGGAVVSSGMLNPPVTATSVGIVDTPTPSEPVSPVPTTPAPAETPPTSSVVTEQPVATDTPTPSQTATLTPSHTPTIEPTNTQRITPTDEPTIEPTDTLTLTPTPPTPTIPQVITEARENTLIGSINELRANAGCNTFVLSPALTEAADRHSRDMAATGNLSIQGSDGSTDNSRASEAGYPGFVRQNVGRGLSPDNVISLWTANTQTNNQMLDCTFSDIGVSAVDGNDGRVYWTAVFGRP